MEKIKLLWYGDSPTANTGFGNVSRNILKHLQETDKYAITVLGIQYFEDPNVDLKIKESMPYRILGAGDYRNQDMFGREKLLALIENEHFDVIVTLQDLQNLDVKRYGAKTSIRESINKSILKAKKETKWVIYTPIDGQLKEFELLPTKEADFVVFYNQFGQQEYIKALIHTIGSAIPEVQSTYIRKKLSRTAIINHGSEPETFYPVSKKKALKFREAYFKGKVKPTDFLIINVNRNQNRKNLQKTIEAFMLVKAQIPNAMLYLHCVQKDVGGDMLEILQAFGAKDIILPGEMHPIWGIKSEALNLIYNTADLYMTTTLGEGWGLSVTEAMACKCPVIIPRNTSLIEIGQDRAVFAESKGFSCEHRDFYRLRPVTDAEDMAQKIVKIAKGEIDTKPLVKNAYNWIQSIKWESIVKQWDSLLCQLTNKGWQTNEEKR